MRPSLLVVELWGLGDLVIATPFLREASKRFDVTLLAKPYAHDLQKRFWPDVEVVTFMAPWTAFRSKYALLSWPWADIFALRHLAGRRFHTGLSARWDPRDHVLLWLLRVRRRVGFPRLKSHVFLTKPVALPGPGSHRYENWQNVARTLGFELPLRENLPQQQRRHEGVILVHSGAGQPVRVWPLERYRALVQKLRQQDYRVQVACDPDQQAWWTQAGETQLATPSDVTTLMGFIDRAAVFIGNDSGPAHLAAFLGAPTLTIFGPQLPDWFAPLHPRGEWIEGKPCPYKPCSDYCRFPVPYCMLGTSEEEVSARVAVFLRKHLPAQVVPAS